MASDLNPQKFRTRHAQVAMGIGRGLTNKQIAKEIGISKHTVAAFVREVLWLLGVKNRTEAATWVATKGDWLRSIIANEAREAREKKEATDARPIA